MAAPRRSRSAPTIKASRVARWGNSLGLRIPQQAAKVLGLQNGDSVDVELRGDSLVVRRAAPRRKWTEAELLKGVTPRLVGGEVDSGGPVGREAW